MSLDRKQESVLFLREQFRGHPLPSLVPLARAAADKGASVTIHVRIVLLGNATPHSVLQLHALLATLATIRVRPGLIGGVVV